MNCLPSPPRSPYLEYEEEEEYALCGTCNKRLGSDWFCSDCHQKCSSCNRFLSQGEYCTRCWTIENGQFKRKYETFLTHLHQQMIQLDFSRGFVPTPSNSTGSNKQ